MIFSFSNPSLNGIMFSYCSHYLSTENPFSLCNNIPITMLNHSKTRKIRKYRTVFVAILHKKKRFLHHPSIGTGTTLIDQKKGAKNYIKDIFIQYDAQHMMERSNAGVSHFLPLPPLSTYLPPRFRSNEL